jgi:hypothetical protein
MTKTIDLARAAGHDAGNRHMHDAGRRAWSAADYREAARVMASLIPSVCPELMEFRVTTRTTPTYESLFHMTPFRE